MNQNEDTNFITTNATSINIDYSDYSNNKLPLWAKKGLKINFPNDESSTNNLVHRPNSMSSTMSSTPNRTRISVYNSRSTDSDEHNSVDDGQHAEQFESPIDRLKKKAQQLSISVSNNDSSIKSNGGDHNDVDELSSSTKKKNPLYVSTENLKYNDMFFAKTPLPKSTSSSSQLTGTLSKPSPAQKPSVLINQSTPKLSNNQLNTNVSLSSSSLNNSLNSSTAVKSNTMNRPQTMSKRREELARALSEARAKLQNLTDVNRKSTGGLSTSMSVANINRLSLNLSAQQQKESNSMLVTAPIQKSNLNRSINQSQQSYENDAVRRSISLSDLSHTLSNRSLSLKQQQQNRNKLSPASNNVYYPLRNFKKSDAQQQPPPPPQQFDPPQGLWDLPSKQPQFEQHQQTNFHQDRVNASLNASQNSINQLHHNGGTPTHKPIRVRMSRSSSMASINKNDSLARNLDSNKSQGLWQSPSSLSINTLRSNSSAQNSFNKFNHHNKSHHRKASSDDESSSDENDLYHRISQRPSTPPKPNIRQLRRSSTTSNNLFLPNNNAHNNSANLTLQQQPQNNSTIKSAHKQSSSTRKTWSNNFELRPAKSEYNLNSMGQETVNSPSSGFWSNQSNSGNNNGHQSNGKMTNGTLKPNKQNTIGYENFDLTNINPATVPLTAELFQHIVDELNHLGTFAKKINYRAQSEDNDKLCNLLKEGVSKAYVNLATIVPFSSNNVLPITKSLSNHNHKESNNNFNHHHHHNLSNNLNNGHHADSSNTDHDTEEDNNLSSPLNNNNSTVGHVSLTSDSASSSLPQESMALNLLQHYSERLLSMVEGQIKNKDK